MTERRPIRVIPEALKNQIAAGEVVERPASVVKELVENSLDAGALRLDIGIERGGQGLVMVRDDGSGIPGDELLLAVTRHATSKINRLEDLAAISSLGFRGEALPSIGSVSAMRVTSRSAQSDEARFIEVEAGRVLDQGPAALDQGTRVEVRDLFSCVPARLKFLKTEAGEARRCQDAVMRLCLAHCGAGFSMTVNSRQVLSLPQGQALADRVRAFWPPAVCQGLRPVSFAAGGIKVSGLAGDPAAAQSRPDRILLYVNRRPIRDRLMLAAVRQAYKGRLLSSECPQAVVFLDLALDLVDVNVHPAKQEVRFRDEGAVFSAVRLALASALSGRGDDIMREPVSGFGQGPGSARGPDIGPWARPHGPAPERPAALPLPLAPAPGPGPGPRSAPRGPIGLSGRDVTYLGQLARTYLVLEIGRGRLGLLDQHAAHERVLFEALRAAGSKGETRPLAAPLELPLHASAAARLEDIWDPLARVGFVLEMAGPERLLMRGAPPGLDAGRAKGYLEAVLDSRARTLEDLWALMACKSAIKAGQALAADEALALVEAWLDCPGRDYCPHGRPVMVSWEAAELEKLFKRK
ncbi:MAG: DNA mismatch repair endonuclease MutL [Desulfovibrionaceae bacterium]|nr:DNA mismatch repair endonuclease MutL [Desulfovibrionaceae bacterium]